MHSTEILSTAVNATITLATTTKHWHSLVFSNSGQMGLIFKRTRTTRKLGWILRNVQITISSYIGAHLPLVWNYLQQTLHDSLWTVKRGGFTFVAKRTTVMCGAFFSLKHMKSFLVMHEIMWIQAYQRMWVVVSRLRRFYSSTDFISERLKKSDKLSQKRGLSIFMPQATATVYSSRLSLELCLARQSGHLVHERGWTFYCGWACDCCITHTHKPRDKWRAFQTSSAGRNDNQRVYVRNNAKPTAGPVKKKSNWLKFNSALAAWKYSCFFNAVRNCRPRNCSPSNCSQLLCACAAKQCENKPSNIYDII